MYFIAGQCQLGLESVLLPKDHPVSLILCENLLFWILCKSNKKGPVIFSSDKETSFYIGWISQVELIFKEEKHSFYKIWEHPLIFNASWILT